MGGWKRSCLHRPRGVISILIGGDCRLCSDQVAVLCGLRENAVAEVREVFECLQRSEYGCHRGLQTEQQERCVSEEMYECVFAYTQPLFSLAREIVLRQVMSMTQQTTLADFERRAAALGTPLYKIARAAGLSPSTYYRWKGTAKAQYENVIAVKTEIERMENAQ